MDKSSQRKADVAAYKAARKALNDHHPAGGQEDAEYERLNKAVIDAEKRIPWHRRW